MMKLVEHVHGGKTNVATLDDFLKVVVAVLAFVLMGGQVRIDKTQVGVAPRQARDHATFVAQHMRNTRGLGGNVDVGDHAGLVLGHKNHQPHLPQVVVLDQHPITACTAQP
jgi:hypothetical protein